MKKIIFAGLEYDRYEKKFGRSFEYNNFYLGLAALPGVQTTFFSFQPIIQWGRSAFNRRLIELVDREQPDLLFVFMYTDELDIETLKLLKRKTTTLAWFSDDHWRFDNYSRHYAPYFSWVATTYSKAPEQYRRIGQHNVVRSQWFCNSDSYKPVPVEKDIAVSFVGLKNRGRARAIAVLRNAGIPIFVFGSGWEGGKLPQAEFVRLFSRSRINVNLNNPRSLWEPTALGRLALRRSINRFVPDFHVVHNIRSWRNMRILQIKARPFEIAACGGFCLSGYADDIERYYEDGKEMVFYKDTADLIENIRYYLVHNDERERIARAGYERTIREHTYKERFSELFRAIGFMQ